MSNTRRTVIVQRSVIPKTVYAARPVSAVRAYVWRAAADLMNKRKEQ